MNIRETGHALSAGRFDSRSKESDEELPSVNLTEVQALLREYFPPDGTVVW